MRTPTRTIISLALVGLLGGAASLAQAQQVSGRVISSTPIHDANGQAGYSVTYEYAGQRYTTRTDSPPGQTIALQLSPMGVATNSPAPDQPPPAAYNDGNPQNWNNVEAQPGVVVGAGGAPAPAYGAPVYGGPVYGAPGYAQPMYVQPAYGYGYGYAAPWLAVAPIGLSLNFGYSHGWGGGYYRHGWH
ncbi:hypothetical protein [Variovorax sp. dw_954]|uniref:hypothetical protein n=1 Tax=Variovorax sp. dw_954 TaxID=2720078 RepID=UPI001BD510C5|nr:hypothetical protein [Variovorax sp. dw_954]